VSVPCGKGAAVEKPGDVVILDVLSVSTSHVMFACQLLSNNIVFTCPISSRLRYLNKVQERKNPARQARYNPAKGTIVVLPPALGLEDGFVVVATVDAPFDV
jgi:hypothetical protein